MRSAQNFCMASLDAVGAELLHGIRERFGNEVEFVIFLRASGAFGELDLGVALLLDRLIGEIHRFAHLRFGDELGFSLDHDDLIGAAGIDEFEFALLHFGAGRIDDELAVDEADADRADRAVERKVREHERCGRTDHRKHIGLVHAVGGEQHARDLDLIEEPLGEERTDRAVDHAAGENLLGGGAAFAFDVAAGELACRGIFFPVVDLEREEVRSFARGAGAGRGEDDGVAEADEAGTVGEAGNFAGGDLHLPFAVELENDFFFSHDRFPFLLLGCFGEERRAPVASGQGPFDSRNPGINPRNGSRMLITTEFHKIKPMPETLLSRVQLE